MPPSEIRLPPHLRPVSVIVHTRTDGADPPTVLGAFAVVSTRGIRQSRLETEGAAGSFAQGVLLVLVRALGAIPKPLPGIRVYVPDRTVMNMVNGSAVAHTPATAHLVGIAQHLLAEKAPGAVVEHGRFPDLVRGLLAQGENIWD